MSDVLSSEPRVPPSSGGLTAVSVTAPITGDGTPGNPLDISPATPTDPGSMSAANFTKLAGIAAGATNTPISVATPQPVGTATAGATGSASDAGHAHDLPDIGPGAGAIANPSSVTIDAKGRVTAASAGSAPPSYPLSVANGGTGAATFNAHEVLAGPTSGAAAAPTRRVLVDTDIPPEVTRNSLVANVIPFDDFNNSLGDTAHRFAEIFSFYLISGANPLSLVGDTSATSTGPLLMFNNGTSDVVIISKDGISAHLPPFGDLPSASTISPTRPINYVTGSTTINNITVPDVFVGGYAGTITLIFANVMSWTAAGNIALAGTSVVGKAVNFTYYPGLDKWFPSAVS